MSELRSRLAIAFGAVLVVTGIGVGGFYWLGHGRWALHECLYMTITTLFTVGFGEILPGFEDVPHARSFTMVLIVLGVGTFLYFASTLTAIILEGDLQAAFRKTRMRKQIEKLSGHVIVCGSGSTGWHVVEELLSSRVPVCVIEQDQERVERLVEAHPQVPYIQGDATEDAVLMEAGVERARGVVGALSSDKDNLFVVVTARQANPGCRIVARVSEVRAIEKLRKAGADAVVSPNYIGGMRMSAELLRPHVVEFLDEMLRDKDKNLRIEEVAIGQGSAFVGQTLGSSRFRQVADVLVLAIRDATRGFVYNPGPDLVLTDAMKLIVLGPMDAVHKLRDLLTAGA